MINTMKKITLLLAITLGCSVYAGGLYAQDTAQRDSAELIDPRLNEFQNRFLNQQAHALLGLVNETLVAYPPQQPEPEVRRLALLMLDGVLHDVYAPYRPPVQQFFHTRMDQALGEIETTSVDEGARIWKLYNHGFVVRTATVTIGFDLIRGHSVRAEGFALEDDIMARVVRQCDALFISHRHGDHADEWVAQAFIDQGKPVVAPPEIWVGKPIHSKITHFKREAHTLHPLPVQNGLHELRVVLYPGHQGDNIQNNVTLVFTPEGMSFSQTGDQSNSDDFEWIDQVGQHHRVDVLMPNCWTTDIVRMILGFNPVVVITGHENEMGHTIDHREPYWLTYQRKVGSDRFGGSRTVGYSRPLVLMTWGESFHYLPR